MLPPFRTSAIGLCLRFRRARHIEEPGEWIRAAHKEEQPATQPEGDDKEATV